SVVATGIDVEAGNTPVDIMTAQTQVPRRIIRPLASSSSVVAPVAYNPVNASIQQLAERVQDLPTANVEPVRTQVRPVEIVQTQAVGAAQAAVAVAVSPPQARPEPQRSEPQRAEPAREPATSERRAAAPAPASVHHGALPGALGPAGARHETARGEDAVPR